MSTKPSAHAEWDTNGTNMSATTSGHKSDGWANNEIPTAAEFNYWQNQVSAWTKWLYDGDMVLNDTTIRDLLVTGQLKLTGSATKTLSASTTAQNLDVVGAGSNLLHIYEVRVTVGGVAAFLGGIAGGVDGLEIVLTHVSGSYGFGITREDSGSTAANRITYSSTANQGGGTFVVNPGESVRLRYVGSLSRWVVLDGTKVEDYGSRHRQVPIEVGAGGGTFLTYNTTIGANGCCYTSSNAAWTWWSQDHGTWGGVRQGEQLTAINVKCDTPGGAGTFATARLYKVSTSGTSSELENWAVATGAAGWGTISQTLATPRTIGTDERYFIKLEGTTSGDRFGGISVKINPFPL